jgi:uncharacterized protein
MSRSHFLQPFLQKSAPRQYLRNMRTRLPVATTVETAFGSSDRRRGLLGRDSLPAGHAIVIAPTFLVHTFGMRFSIDLLFVARDGRIMKVQRAVPPRRIAGTLGAFAVVELAAGQIDSSGTRVGDSIEAIPV